MEEQRTAREDDEALRAEALEQTPLVLGLYDAQLRILQLSAATRRQLRLGDRDLRGQRLTDLFPGNPDMERTTRDMRRVVETGEIVHYVHVASARSMRRVVETVEGVRYVSVSPVSEGDRERAWSIIYAPVRNSAGRVHGVLGAAFDVTEQYLARERLALLNEAGSRVGSTLDVVRTAGELAEVAVPGYADWASVDLLDPVYSGGEAVLGRLVDPGVPVVLRRAAHRSTLTDRMRVAVPLGQVETYPQFSPPARCLATGRPVLHLATDPEIARWVADNSVWAAAVHEHGLSSVMFVPLRARGMTLGLAVFARHGPLYPFQPDDLLLADELAAKAAVAIDNARRYTRERVIALALQRSLLPQRLPDQAAVEVASRYRPAEFGVGGDWFDVILLSGEQVALVVGDVFGHGIRAAVTMGRLRTAVRTLADGEPAPQELLTRLDDVAVRLAAEESPTPGGTDGIDETGDTGDTGATCLYAVYDPVSRRCSLARAGHPPPVAVTPDGRVRLLDVPAGPPLGVGGLPFEAVDVDLPAGTLLALYTDGLVESRDRDIDDGLNKLRHVLVRPAPTLDATCDTVLDALLPEQPADDAALLLARTRSLDEGQVVSWELPADPAVVAYARKQTNDQLAAWGLDDLAFTTELVVSELVTNAIRYGRGPVGLRLIRTSTLTCEVSDSSDTAPRMRRARTFDENGRGLLLVAQLTKRWGSRPTADGKTIWAEQSLSGDR